MIDEGFKNIVNQMAEGRQRLEKELEGVPFEATTFSPEAINKIILINKDLKKATKGLDTETALAVATAYLDSHSWEARFTSGDVGRLDERENSMYYVTPEGACLRLRKHYIKKGADISRVIQPFMEKVVFEDDKESVFSEPRIGLNVQEYSTPEFLKLQNSENETDKPFESHVRVYHLSSGQTVFTSKEGRFHHVHSGDTVNKIF